MDEPPDSGNLKDLIQAAQRIQAEVARVRAELDRKTVEGESGGGLVRCVVSGAGELVSLTIDPALAKIDEGPGSLRMIEDLVVGAVNLALGRARETAQQELARVTGGLPMPPGMFGG